MNVKDRSENAFDTIRIRGKWWIPDGTENPRKVPGELTFAVSAGGTLELDEALANKIEEILVIHGEGIDGECVTIFNGFVASARSCFQSNDSFETEIIEFYDMWIGNCWFDDREDARFIKYSFGIHNIENWADQRCFSAPPPSVSKRRSLVYKSPEPILLFEDDYLRIDLDSFCMGPSLSVGQLESSIRHYPRIVIRSKSGRLPYYDRENSISEREWMIFVLIALLMGIVTWKFGFEGVVEPLKKEGEGYVQEVAVRHYSQRDWGPVDPLKRPTHFSLLFPFSSIAKQFPRIAIRFSEVLRANENPIDLVYLLQCRKRTFYPSTLPELLFAFERLVGSLFPKDCARLVEADKAVSKRLRKRLNPHCTSREWDWLEPRLSPRLSFASKCRIAFRQMAKVYPELESDLQKPLIRYLFRTRNRYAHEVESMTDNSALYVYTIHWFAEFMTLMILRSCGLSSRTIRKVFFRKLGPDRGKTQRFFEEFRMEVKTGSLG